MPINILSFSGSHSVPLTYWTRIIVFAGMCLPGLTLAAESQNTDSHWALGLGVATVDREYKDFDRKYIPLPVISYENRWISASVPTFDVKLFSGESLSFRLRARWAGEGYKAKDSPVFSGMEKRDPGVWAGGALLWKNALLNVTAELLADAMDNSKGTRGKLQIDRRFTAGKFGFTPRLAAEWVDENYVEYYYGVRLSEVQAGRPFYEGGATTNINAGLRMDYTPANHHTLFADVGATRFGNTVRNSPLVDKAQQVTIALGYVYRF